MKIAENLAKIASVSEAPEGPSAAPRKLVGRIERDYFLLDLDEA